MSPDNLNGLPFTPLNLAALYMLEASAALQLGIVGTSSELAELAMALEVLTDNLEGLLRHT